MEKRGPCPGWALFLRADKENRNRKPLQYKILGFEILKVFHLKGYFFVFTEYTSELDIK